MRKILMRCKILNQQYYSTTVQDYRPTIGYHSLTKGCHGPTIGYHRPTIGYYRPTIGYHQPTIGYHQPTIGYHRPTLGYHKPTIGHHRPTIGYHKPTIGCLMDLLDGFSTPIFVAKEALGRPIFQKNFGRAEMLEQFFFRFSKYSQKMTKNRLFPNRVFDPKNVFKCSFRSRNHVFWPKIALIHIFRIF